MTDDPLDVCCADSTCGSGKNLGNSCSSPFYATNYALTMCPQNPKKCGDVQDIFFSHEGESQVVEIMGMQAGDSCTYKITADCGAPGFSIDSTLNTTDYDVTYVEWNDMTIGSYNVSTLATPIAARNSTSPAKGQPIRSQIFSYFSNIVADTYGYTGTYNKTIGDNLIYGNNIQGGSFGFSNSNMGCAPRNMLVTISTNVVQEVHMLNLNASSFKIIEGDGATALQIATASLVGLVAASLF